MNREELAARRERYFDLVASGMSFTAAARVVGVSKRTGKVWRNRQVLIGTVATCHTCTTTRLLSKRG